MALRHEDDAIEARQQIQPVHRGDDARVGKGRAEAGEDARLGDGVEAARRLVEKQQRAAARREYAARERHALLLSAGQVDAALGDHGVESLRQRGDDRLEARDADGFAQHLGRIVEPERDVVAHAALEDLGVLRYQRRELAEMPQLGVRPAIDGEDAAAGIVETGEHAHERAFSRPARAHERDPLPAPEGKRHVAQGRRFAAVARITELERGHVYRAPGLRDAAILLRAALVGVPDRIGARVVRLHAREMLVMRRERPHHAAGLLRVCVDHEDVPEQQGAAVLGHPCVAADERPGEGYREQIHHAPLRLGDDDVALQRHEDLVEPLAQQPARGVLQPQAQHGGDVAEAVDEGCGIAALGVVLALDQAHQHAVEAHDDVTHEQVAGERQRAGERREQRESNHRPGHVDEVLEINELVLREVVERVRRLVDAMARFAGVVALVPCERQIRKALVQAVGDVAADFDADGALEDAAGAVQRPREHGSGQDEGHEPAGVLQIVEPRDLYRVDRLRCEPRYAQLHELRAHEQCARCDAAAAFAFRVAPEGAEKPDEAGRGGR